MFDLNILLISTYELGRQPFGLASPAAWLGEAGATVHCLDLSVEPLDVTRVRGAQLIGFYVPMHMGTRMAVPAIKQVRFLNPQAHICCFGLYAPMNESYLRQLGVDSIHGGEFEAGLVTLARQVATRNGKSPDQSKNGQQPLPAISLDRQEFHLPDRSSLPPLSRYARLVTASQQQRLVGYTEASRGCKHTCRHCPIVPVYRGRFRIIAHSVVLADIRQQVRAGAQHITFGDPDFFNGPGHAIPLVDAMHREFPDLTYDVTIKVEHLLRYGDLLSRLRATGCLFITTAVEAFDADILTRFDKGHSLAEFEQVVAHCREIGLDLVPTFVPFTPWTTLAGYRKLLQEIVRLDLMDHVSPIQYAIGLLIPPGSKLLDLPETQAVIGPLDEARLSYSWHNPDHRVDQLQSELEVMVQRFAAQQVPRREAFRRIWLRTFEGVGDAGGKIPFPHLPSFSRFIPYLTEPWYC
jgi:radical SAM superfamily enzyme YgiQ (UPF0313 family)